MRDVHRSPSIGLTEPWTWVAVLEQGNKRALLVCGCRAFIWLRVQVILLDGTVVDDVECPVCGATEQVRLVNWAIAA